MARFDLRDRAVVITGGANGIGQRVARAVVARGGYAAILDVDADGAATAARSIGERSIGLGADVRELDALKQAFSEIVERLGGVDVVIAGAGIERSGLTVDSGSREQQRAVLDVNLHGVWNTAWAGLPHVIQRKGHFVAISSVAAYVAAPLGAAYCASKAGVEQLVRCLRIELASVQATAGVVHFGMIDTTVRAGIHEDPLMRRLVDLTPSWIEKVMTPEQAAETLLRGVECRALRTVYPARWRLAYALRGVAGPLMDAAMARNAKLQELMRDARERDRARADRESSSTGG
jgi:NAD(P)-dependent dehydrogenase (short-subunit alcohol dehydrogenase family)